MVFEFAESMLPGLALIKHEVEEAARYLILHNSRLGLRPFH